MLGRSQAGLVIALGACGPSSSASSTEESSSSGSTAAETGTSVPSDSGSTSLGLDTSGTTSGETGSTSTSTSTSSGTTACDDDEGDESTGGPQSVCDPQPEDIVVDIDFDPDYRGDDAEIAIDAACIVTALVPEEPTRLRIELSCEDRGAQVVAVVSDPPLVLPLAVDDPVRLQAAELHPIDTGDYECLALRDGDDALVVGQYQTYCPVELADPATWLAPLAVELRTDVCEPEPYTPPPDCPFIQDPCPGQDERAAFEVLIGDDGGLVHDRTAATIGPYDVRVPHATRHYPDDDASCGAGPYDSGTIVVQRL